MPQIQGQYAPAGSTWYNSSAVEEVVQVKAAPGLLFALAVTNSNVGTRFIYLFDDDDTSSGNVIWPPIPVAAGAQVVLALPFAVQFTEGLRIHASSTNATFTAAAGNDIWLSVLYK